MIDCIICNSPLKVTVTGGEFLVIPTSTDNNINFETPQHVDFETATVIDEDSDTMLRVTVQCSANPDHIVFGTIHAKICTEIYQRIGRAAQQLFKKYYSA